MQITTCDKMAYSGCTLHISIAISSYKISLFQINANFLMRSRPTFIILNARYSLSKYQHLGPRTSYIFPSKKSDQLNSSSQPIITWALRAMRSHPCGIPTSGRPHGWTPWIFMLLVSRREYDFLRYLARPPASPAPICCFLVIVQVDSVTISSRLGCDQSMYK